MVRTRFKLVTGQGGFTLIELMLVIAIMAILANIALVISGTVLRKARDGRRKSDLDALRMAVELYYTDHGTYTMAGILASGEGSAGNVNEGNGESIPGYVVYPGSPMTTYLQSLGYLNDSPICDPLDQPPCYANFFLDYYYVVCGNGTTFSLSTTLEDPAPADLAEVPLVCGATLGPPADGGGAWVPIDDPTKGKNYAIP